MFEQFVPHTRDALPFADPKGDRWVAEDTDPDRTPGQFTTAKLQSLLDSGVNPDVRNRRDVAELLKAKGARISVHGVEAWFRRVDSNYNHTRESLHPSQPSFALPGRHWPLLLDIFDLAPKELDLNDENFGRHCLARARADHTTGLRELDRNVPEHLPGRDAEFSQILSDLQASANTDANRAGLILLEGAAGMGKSSLLEELVRRIRLSGGLCVTASCVESVQVPLLPLLDFLRLQISEVARAGADAIRLAETIVEKIERANEQPTSAAARTDDLFLLGTDLLVTLARDLPLVVVVDDVHWLDDVTRELLVHFATFLRLNREHKVILLLAGREFSNELIHRMPTGDFSRRITLNPLTRPAIRQATKRILGHPLGPQARDYVWSISEGNPLYLEQLTEHLAASRQLRLANGVLELATPVDAVDVPASLDDYYRQRFIKLDREAAHLLQLAACFGQQLNSEFLQLLVPGTTTESLLAALDRAEAAGLLRFNNNAYLFSHPVARHSVYGAIPEANRARLHAQIARVIESSTQNRSPHASIEFAYHQLRGRPYSDSQTTLEACAEAAQHSHSLGAWPSAEYFATAALTLADGHGGLSDDRRGSLLRLRGSCRHQTARPDVALQDLEQALKQFQSDQNTIEYVQTLTQVVRIRANFSQVRDGQNEAAEELDGYVTLLSESNREVAANALEVLAGYRLANNDSQGALRLAERVIDEFGEVVGPEKYALSRITAGVSALNHLDGQAGFTHLSEATSFARSVNHGPSLDRALQRLVLAQLLLGRLNDVFVTFDEIQNVRKRSTTTGEHTAVLAAVSAALAIRGSYEDALGFIADALELIDVTGYRFMETTLVGIEVYCLSRLGQYPGALEAVDRLEVARPRRAARLLRDCAASYQKGSDEYPDPLSESDRVSLLSDRAPDLGELARVMMLGQLALSSGDTEVLEGVLVKLRVAESAGFVFATAWPVQLPVLMGSLCLRLGNERDAHYFLRRSVDYSRLHSLRSQLRDLHALLLADWPEEQELLRDVELALQAKPESNSGLTELVSV